MRGENNFNSEKGLKGELSGRWKGGVGLKRIGICGACGKKFEFKPFTKRGRFCSIECMGISRRSKKLPQKIIRKISKTLNRIWKDKTTFIKCSACGKIFKVWESQTKKGQREILFCKM